jgi:hypothetical protein
MERSIKNLNTMKEEIPELRILRHNRFIVYVAFFTVLSMTPNTFYVFNSFCVFQEPYRTFFSGAVALIVAFFIMLFLARKNLKVSLIFCAAEIIISGYYYITTIGLKHGLVAASVFVIILPYAVSQSTKEIDRKVIYEDDSVNKFLDNNPTKRQSDFMK